MIIKTDKQLEKLIGIITERDLKHPKSSANIQFPENSSLIWSNGSIIGRARGSIYIEDEYKEPIGKFIKVIKNHSHLISAFKRDDVNSDFKIILNKPRISLVRKNELLVIDTSHLDKVYKYQKYSSAEYDKFYNRVKTSLEWSNDSLINERAIFYKFDIPKSIPDINIIKKAIDSKRPYNYVDYSQLELIELLKVFKYDSLFKNVKKKNSFYIWFTLKGNTIFRLDRLLSLGIKEYSTSITPKGNPEMELLKLILKVAINPTPRLDKIKEAGNIVEVKSIDELLKEHRLHNNVNDTIKIEDDGKSIKDVKLEEKSITDLAKESLNNKQISGEKTKSIKEIERILSSQNVEWEIPDEDIKLEGRKIDIPTILEDEMKIEKTVEMTNKYVKKVFHKHKKQSIYSIQSTGNIIKSHNVEFHEDINNRYEKHTLHIMQSGGGTVKVSIILPIPNEEGVFKLNGNEYKFKKQRTDVPIKKIRSNRVALSSYYSKMFVSRGELVANSFSAGINAALKKSENTQMVINGKIEIPEVKLPQMYTTIALNIKNCIVDNIFYSFDYYNRKTIFGEEYKGMVPVGREGNDILYMNDDGIIYKKDKPLNHILELWHIDLRKLPVESVDIRLLGNRVPIVILFLWYYGFNNLIKILKCKTREFKNNKDLQPDEYVLHFKHKSIVFSRNDKEATLIFGGLHKFKMLKHIDANELDSRDGVVDLIMLFNFSPNIGKEMDLLNSSWVDPITKDVLKRLKEPTTWKGILFRVVELLKDDYYRQQNRIDSLLIKGYDRFNGMLYNILIKAIKAYEYKQGRVKGNITVNPYDMINILAEDGTFTLLEDINPMSNAIQKEDITVIGAFGRNKDSVNATDRMYDDSWVGVVGEASKDSANVGMQNFYSAVPKVENLYGMAKEHDLEDLNISNILTTSAILAPESSKDDGKRLMFINIQNKHIVPSDSGKVNPFRTGYENIIPYKVDKKFATHADGDGVVKDITDRKIVIKYKDSEKSYSLVDWFGKDAGGLTYRHPLKTMLKKGDKVKKYDNITYDTSYFEPDIYNKGKVAYKTGEPVKIILDDSKETFEDAFVASAEWAKNYTTKIVKVRDIIVKGGDEIKDMVQIGDYLKYEDKLLVIINKDDDVDIELSQDSIELIEDIKSNAPKSEVPGKVIKIELFYRPDIKDLSKSIKKLVLESDDLLKDTQGFTGKVDHTYSVNGRPLEEDEVHIRFYIEKPIDTQLGDKIVIANQLKSTLSLIIDDMETEYGEKVHLRYGFRGEAARIVNSPAIMGSTLLIIEALNKEIVNIWEKE